MIAALLGWTKLPQWALELIVIGAAVAAVFYWQHHLIEKGVKEQQAADATELKNLVVKNDKESADLKARATTAEQAYDKEHQSNLNFQQLHPLPDVRLCLESPNKGSGAVSGGKAQDQGNVGTGASTANVPKVPGGNSSGGQGTPGPNIAGLLDLLAAKADDVSATLREFQSR